MIPICAVLDSGALILILSSQFTCRLCFLPDVKCSRIFGTAGNNPARSKGTYSLVPLKFGDTVVTCPAIVLEAKNYSVLIGSSFMDQFGTTIDNKTGMFHLLGQEFPLLTPDDWPRVPPKGMNPRVCILLACPSGMIGIPDETTST